MMNHVAALLGDYTRLKKFYKGEEDLAHIQTAAPSALCRRVGHLVTRCLQVAYAFPLSVASVLPKGASAFCSLVGWTSCSLFYMRMVRALERGLEELRYAIVALWKYRSPVLVSATNQPKMWDWDLMCPVPQRRIAPRIRSFVSAGLFSQSAAPFRPYHPGGSCLGATIWFAHLYLQSKKSFTDPQRHLMEVAKRFTTGIPKQGVLLQTLCRHNEKNRAYTHFLGCQLVPMSGYESDTISIDLRPDLALQRIRALPSGIYCSCMYRHALAYVKLENGQTFLWDPNHGLLKLDAKQFLDYVAEHHIPGHLRSNLFFFRVENSKWTPLFYRIQNVAQTYRDFFQTLYHEGWGRIRYILTVPAWISVSYLILKRVELWTGILPNSTWAKKGAKVALGIALKVLIAASAIIETLVIAMLFIPVLALKPFLACDTSYKLSLLAVATAKTAYLALRSLACMHAPPPVGGSRVWRMVSSIYPYAHQCFDICTLIAFLFLLYTFSHNPKGVYQSIRRHVRLRWSSSL